MTRKEILDAAALCVCTSREQDYRSPEDGFAAIAAFWETYIKFKGYNDVCVVNGETVVDAVDITPEDVANMMILLKVARNTTGRGKEDNYVDIAGYAACGGEISTNG